MDGDAFYHVPRGELQEILEYLRLPNHVLLLGEPGTGKTTLLSAIAKELAKEDRPAFAVSLRDVRYAGDLGKLLLQAVAASPYEEAVVARRTLRSSTGDLPLDETAAVLNHLCEPVLMRDGTSVFQSPVLLLDGFDESALPGRLASAIEQLTMELEDNWGLIVASRPAASKQLSRLRRLRRFRVIHLGGFATQDVAGILRAAAPSLPGEVINRIIKFTDGNPVLVEAIARNLQRSATLAPVGDGAASLMDALEWMVNEAISASPDPAKLGELLDELALAGAPEQTKDLAVRTRIADQEVLRLLSAPRAGALVILDRQTGTAELFHDSLRDMIIARRVLTTPFRAADLRFGDEEAEADRLLDQTYVYRPDVDTIITQQRPLVVGERGSGKSAIFRRLSEAAVNDASPGTRVLPVAKPHDLLYKVITDDKDWLDTNKVRTAWLMIVAAMLHDALPGTAPKELRRKGVGVRAALGLSVPPASPLKSAVNTGARLLGGTALKVSAGPAQIEVKLPSGSGVGTGTLSVNVASFLDEANKLLGESGLRAVVMVDQIDEIAKWDVPRRMAVVRGLLQAVRDVHPQEHIQFVAFLRTDLYEQCDVQEKTKLVSKMVTLKWEEEDWLQVLARRVLANAPLQPIRSRLRGTHGNVDVLGACRVLFPAEIEGQPIDRWLIDSLRNGNGNVSPRLAVNLLTLAGEQAAKPTERVTTLPLFSADEAGRAMTKLSDLAFDEVVNDFKVAPSFVLACRASKRFGAFAKEHVQGLFNAAEGDKEEQVLLLERLGFLERVVQEGDSGLESLFRIPKLYTRCWDHA